jgi:hypothetical protein
MLAGISIVNEKIIIHKNKTILRKRYEYKMELSKQTENNHNLHYLHQKQIRERAKKRGFVEAPNNNYKIAVTNH